MLRENTPISFELTLTVISKAVYAANYARQVHSRPLNCLTTSPMLSVSTCENCGVPGNTGASATSARKKLESQRSLLR